MAERGDTQRTFNRRGILAVAGAVVAAFVAKQTAQPVAAAALTLDTDNPSIANTNINGPGAVVPWDIGDQVKAVLSANNAPAAGNSTGIAGSAGIFGVYGRGDSYGVYGTSTGNVGGAGVGGSNVAGDGVRGMSGSGSGVQGQSDTGIGVVGKGGTNQPGIKGTGTGNADGAQGYGAGGYSGVAGFGGPNGGAGLIGLAGLKGTAAAPGAGVIGVASGAANPGAGAQAGVYGSGGVHPGVYGVAAAGTGVYGVTGASSQYGVLGTTTAANSTAIAGIANMNGSSAFSGGTTNPNAFAAFFQGAAVVQGNFAVTGNKSAVVQHPRTGDHRLLYCVESPESWFEDFGESTLAGGNAEVALDPDFAALIHTDRYHVFLTAHDAANKGLAVVARRAAGFSVQEQQGGTSGGTFSWRVVAKRKDIAGERLGKFTMPNLPLPDVTKLTKL